MEKMNECPEGWTRRSMVSSRSVVSLLRRPARGDTGTLTPHSPHMAFTMGLSFLKVVFPWWLSLWDGCQDDEAKLLSVVSSDKTRGNRHKLKHRKFCLNLRKNFFTLRVTEHWNRLPREVVESPSLEILKTCLDGVLCSLL